MCNVDKISMRAKEKGIKIGYICSQLNLTPSYFRDVKAGKTTISEERLKIVADILSTTPAYLKDETDDPEIPKNKKTPLRSIARLEESNISEEEDEYIRKYIDYLISERENNE